MALMQSKIRCYSIAVAAVIVMLALLGSEKVNAADNPSAEEIVNRSFFPYRYDDWREGVEIPPEGALIGPDNLDEWAHMLDDATYWLIEQELMPPIRVGPPIVELEMHPRYVRASIGNVGTVSLRDGNLVNYSGGRPFPGVPQHTDLSPEETGQLLAWNYRHTYAAGEAVDVQYPWIWHYIDMNRGVRQRQLKLTVNFLNYRHRVVHPPIPQILPNPEGWFRALYVKAYSPMDVADTQILLHLFDDDKRRMDGYIYLGFQRRVRRIDTGQLTDAFLGSDVMLQDFEGYFGPVGEMNWKYKGTVTKLMPIFYHNQQDLDEEFANEHDDGYRYIRMVGKGQCFLGVDYSPRELHVLESVPVDTSNPVGRRVHYLDSQSMVMPMTHIFDRAGELWKIFGIPHSSTEDDHPLNEGQYGAIYKGFHMYDVQNQRCTTGQKRTILGSDVSEPHMFTPQYLRDGGKARR